MTNPQLRKVDSFVWPWRIEGKATILAPWQPLANAKTLRIAISEAEKLKIVKRYHNTRVRPN